MKVWVALILAGGVGAWLRFRTDALIRRWWRRAVPIGTLTINMTGTFALAVLTGMLVVHPLKADLVRIFGTGLLGGFTTFSTAMVELVNLRRERRTGGALLLVAAMLVGGVVLSMAGFGVGLSL